MRAGKRMLLKRHEGAVHTRMRVMVDGLRLHNYEVYNKIF